jgi:DNA-binding winged helix-turn-helix (wHTH) protein
MKNLRKRLKDAGADIEIKTIYGLGYKLVEI